MVLTLEKCVCFFFRWSFWLSSL